MMKVIHDLKNPILAIEELVDEEDNFDEFQENESYQSKKNFKIKK